MGTSAVWRASAIEFDTTVIGGIGQRSLAPQVEVGREPLSGQAYPEHVHVTGAQPQFTFGSRNVKALLDELGADLVVSLEDLTAGLDVFESKVALGAVTAAGSVHRKWTATKGIVVPQSLSVEHRGDASLTVLVVPVQDGANDPVVLTASVALPTLLGNDARWTLGSVQVGGQSLTQVQGIELDFGVELFSESSDGEEFLSFVGVQTMAPTLTVRGSNPAWIDAIGLDGLAATHANTEVFLKKRVAGGLFVADETEEHIKMTMYGVVSPGEMSGDTGRMDASLMVSAGHDGTNLPVVFDTAAAIA